MLSILAGYAEEESRSISENAKWSIQKKFERGEQWHAAAYGYKWDGKTFVINEEEAVAIRRIFDDFLHDVPIRQTSKWLKENGHACSMYFIRYVLNNPVYTGQVILQRCITENHRTHKPILNTGQLPHYIIDDNHAAIIDKETFDRVQAKIKANYDFNPAAHRMVKPSPFSAKLICGKCGEHFVKGVTDTNKFDGLQEHWLCYGKWRKHTCNAQNIRRSRLRAACCEMLGLAEFDEEAFSKTVEKIIVDGDLEFHFYDGTIKTATIEYFDRHNRTYKYPQKKPFGYERNSEEFVIIPHEAEADVQVLCRWVENLRHLTGVGIQRLSQLSREIVSPSDCHCLGQRFLHRRHKCEGSIPLPTGLSA